MGEKPTVIHLTTVHNPFDVRIFHKECVSLARAGFDVVLAQRGTQDETREGVRIRALPSYGSRLARMTRGVWRAFRIARQERARIAHLHDIELLWAGFLLRLMGVKVIYDAHEDVAADLEDKAYLPRVAVRPLGLAVRGLERLAGAAFSRIVTATSGIAENFAHARPVLLRNVPILGELAAAEAPPFAARDRRVVYIGGLAPFNGVVQMIRAMAALPGAHGIRLTLGGGFASPEAERAARALPGAEHVDFIGWVDRRRVAEEFSRARAGLVVYQPTANVARSEPNKFFEVLSAGLPLIASDFPHWRALVEAAQCGWLVDESDPDSIAAAILRAVDDPGAAEDAGARGRHFVETERNWAREEGKLVALYRELLGEAPRGQVDHAA